MPFSVLLLIGTNILITGFCSIAARLGMLTMEPLPFAILTQIPAILLLASPLVKAGRLRRLWDPKLLPRLLTLGFLGTSVTSLLLFYAGKTVPASRIVILGQIEILIALAFGALFLKEKVGPAQLAATALVLAGMGLALGAGRMALGKGEIMILCMPLCFQVSHLIGKSLLQEAEPELVSAARALYGVVFLLPLVPFLAPRSAWTMPLTRPKDVALILFTGIVINACSLWLWYAALRKVELSKITTLILTYPLVTLAVAPWVPGLNETVTLVQFLGAALVICGGALLSRVPSPSVEKA
jgi:drug/metabolite transporter (DMT)-like permease